MDIIKSLILPSQMKRYRYMSTFIAIAIFVLSVYILRLPFQITSKNSKNDLIATDVLSVKAFAELDDQTFDFTNIKNAEYIIDGEKLVCNYSDDGAYRYYKTEYEKEGKITRIHIIFDPYNNLEKALANLKSEYMATYNINENSPSNDIRRAAQIANLTYIKMQSDHTLNKVAYFAILHKLSDEKLDQEANQVSNFSYFNIEVTKENPEFVLLFTEKIVEYQIPLFDKDGKSLSPQETRAVITYSDLMKINVKEMNSISDFTKRFANNIIDLYLQYSTIQYTLQAVLIIIIYPLLIVVILWLFFRKRGNLRTFKEYYNIAAISSIIPTLISFIVLWFFPTLLTIYGLILSVFYIFILYRINLTPQEV